MITRRSSTVAILLAGIFMMFLFSVVSCSTSPDSSVALDVSTTKRLECADWRVRYCLANGSRIGTDADRAVLERLIRDSNEKVPAQATVAYLYTFVRVDSRFLRDHVDYFYRLPVGISFITTPDISSVNFHRSMLESAGESPAMASNIQVIGIIGDKHDAAVIRPFLSNSNSYVSYTAAIALARLGFADEAAAALLQQIKQPASDGLLFYQIESLRMLAELDMNSFQQALPEFAARVSHQECTTPARWWRLTQIAWRHGLEIN